MEIEAKLKELGSSTIFKRGGVGGGCVNDAYEYDTDKGKFFVKVMIIIYYYKNKY